MREIKFRAWVPAVRQMWSVRMIDWSEDDLHNGGLHVKLSNVQLNQFTGLRDKNGREIYEGDIVRYKYRSRCGEEEDILVEAVRFVGGEYIPRPQNKECEDTWYSEEYFDFEIIGNIYENAELLNT